MPVSNNHSTCSAIILAGGLGTRAGGRDKGLLQLDGISLIEHVINKLSSQVDDIVISANRNIETYKQLQDKVISDMDGSYSGPLSGMQSCIPHCSHDDIIIVPCDMPHLPADLIKTMDSSNSQNKPVNIVQCHDRLQLVVKINKAISESISIALSNNQRRFIEWATSQPHHITEINNNDYFVNMNNGV